jgi:hypothetical protein
MSRSEREKGKRGEREVARLLTLHGFEARRDGRLDDDLIHNIPNIHIEVKRRETLAIPKWWRETCGACPPDCKPVLAFRSSRSPWLAVVELDVLADLLGLWAATSRPGKDYLGSKRP